MTKKRPEFLHVILLLSTNLRLKAITAYFAGELLPSKREHSPRYFTLVLA